MISQICQVCATSETPVISRTTAVQVGEQWHLYSQTAPPWKLFKSLGIHNEFRHAPSSSQPIPIAVNPMMGLQCKFLPIKMKRKSDPLVITGNLIWRWSAAFSLGTKHVVKLESRRAYVTSVPLFGMIEVGDGEHCKSVLQCRLAACPVQKKFCQLKGYATQYLWGKLGHVILRVDRAVQSEC